MLRVRKRFRVVGNSMHPQIADGADVLVDTRAYRAQRPRVGDIVLARHPYERGVVIVKCVSAVHGNAVSLTGTNSLESTDSRAFGTIALDQLIGRVTSRFG